MSTKHQSPEDEFEAAFAEAAAARQGTAPAAAPAQEPQTAANGAQEGEKPEQAAEAQADPAAAPAQGQEPEQGDQPVDEVAELKRKLSEAEHRERSASNRVSAFHKKLNEAQARVEQLQQQLKAAPKPAASEPAAEDDPELKAALSEMPELGRIVDRLVAKKVAEAVAPVKAQAQEIQESVKPAREFAEQAAVRRELEVVEKEFPDWREIVFSKEYEDWIAGKPQAIRAAYDNATSGADALEFLRMYRLEKGKPAAATTPPPTQSKKPDLTKAVGIPSRPAARPAVGGLPASEDFEAAFEFFAKQRQRQAAAQR